MRKNRFTSGRISLRRGYILPAILSVLVSMTAILTATFPIQTQQSGSGLQNSAPASPRNLRKRTKPPSGRKFDAWTEYNGNSIIKIGETVPFMLWNDPVVLKEGSTYRMWLSGGDPRNKDRIEVDVYTASSKDGISWEINPEPCLSPGPDPQAWDSLRIETPSVVKVDGMYHLYYTGFDETGPEEGRAAIGHATSKDGIRWNKDPSNPVITTQTRDRFKWGFRGVAEPGVIYNPKDRLIYLYYTSLRFTEADPTIAHIGVLLAKSKDGSNFEHHLDPNGDRSLILRRHIPNASPGAWFGYSTPSALISDDGDFHLFCTFLVAPKGPATARACALDHAVSSDGIEFRVVEEDIFVAGEGDWKDQQVRSPTVIEEEGLLKMWFAGETRKPYFSAGIGFAIREQD